MRKKQYILVELSIAVLIISVLLAVSLPRFLTAQRVTSHHPDYLKGTLVKTGDPFDLAINGRGYFCLTRPDGGIVYSRHSEMSVDITGRLVSIYGFVLADNITFPHHAIRFEISIDGLVSAVLQPGYQTVNIGQIQLASFINPDGLVMDENGCYEETEETGPPVFGNPNQNELGMLLQGYQLKNRFDPNTPEHLITNGEYYNGYDDTVQEPLIKTDRPMDFAINGPGWAGVILPDGSMGFTRKLSISKDETGRLEVEWSRTMSTIWGVLVMLKKDEIARQNRKTRMTNMDRLSERAQLIAERSGGVIAAPTNSPAPSSNEDELDELLNPITPQELVNQIQLYRFSSPEKLHYMYKGIYVETDASGPPIPIESGSKHSAAIQSGYLNDVPRKEP